MPLISLAHCAACSQTQRRFLTTMNALHACRALRRVDCQLNYCTLHAKEQQPSCIECISGRGVPHALASKQDSTHSGNRDGQTVKGTSKSTLYGPVSDSLLCWKVQESPRVFLLSGNTGYISPALSWVTEDAHLRNAEKASAVLLVRWELSHYHERISDALRT
ncbi:hypothetical protein EXIGLDRAFT_507341 [Exidia glandulosa HHB12029]|uniref:Uncharacterized protein n=1 Tax=Exidia glandulosa HHB12029 TaxID=1314781 RepID=A0A165PBM5_EXIGL|nr:hypothetical protein EXIGLDRAFT_507341 [Exidia glandulosa HHB12029]